MMERLLKNSICTLLAAILIGCSSASKANNTEKVAEISQETNIKMIDVQGQTLDVAIDNLNDIGIVNIKSVDENGVAINGQKDCYVVSTQSVSANKKIDQKSEVELVAKIQEPPLMENFITRLQDNLGTEITDVVDFDPHDSTGEYYRREFRLGPFDGSFGKHGYINGLPISMVQYGSNGGFYKTNTSFRIYVQFHESDIDTMYPAIVKAFVPDIADEEIQSAIEESENQTSATLLSDVEGISGDYMSVVSYDEEIGRTIELMLDAR